MGRKVGMVHALSSNVRLFNQVSSEVMPDVETVHLVDEGLPSMSGKQYHERVVRRLGVLSAFAVESGAEIVMLTCTAFGRLADQVQTIVNIPVLAVLEIVADEAMQLADSIGILGTHPGTVATASEIIEEQAIQKGKKVEVKTLLCEGAFDALKREDWATYDSIVLKHLNELMEDVKVVVIPQPSIERVVSQIPEGERKIPILTSAHLAVQRLKEKLESLPP